MTHCSKDINYLFQDKSPEGWGVEYILRDEWIWH